MSERHGKETSKFSTIMEPAQSSPIVHLSYLSKIKYSLEEKFEIIKWLSRPLPDLGISKTQNTSAVVTLKTWTRKFNRDIYIVKKTTGSVDVIFVFSLCPSRRKINMRSRRYI